MKKMKPSYSPLKCGNGATPFRGYTVTYIKNFLMGLLLDIPPALFLYCFHADEKFAAVLCFDAEGLGRSVPANVLDIQGVAFIYEVEKDILEIISRHGKDSSFIIKSAQPKLRTKNASPIAATQVFRQMPCMFSQTRMLKTENAFLPK